MPCYTHLVVFFVCLIFIEATVSIKLSDLCEECEACCKWDDCNENVDCSEICDMCDKDDDSDCKNADVVCGDCSAQATCRCTTVVSSLPSPPAGPPRQCQLPGEVCNNITSCCQQALCVNETRCCGLDAAVCITTEDCCQDEPRNCLSGICIRANNTVILNRAGTFTLTVPNQFTRLVFNACGAGGGGASAFTGNNGAGGGSGACLLNVPFFNIAGAVLQIVVGRGGAGGAANFGVTSGANGQLTSVSIPRFAFTTLQFAGAGGSSVGGGGGGSGSNAIGQQGGSSVPPFNVPGGNGGNGGPPQSTNVNANFESGAGGGAGGQSGGNSSAFPGGMACFTAVGNQGGGAASALSPGGNGFDGGGGLCGSVSPNGSLGSGGGSNLDATGGAGGDGVMSIQFFV